MALKSRLTEYFLHTLSFACCAFVLRKSVQLRRCYTSLRPCPKTTSAAWVFLPLTNFLVERGAAQCGVGSSSRAMGGRCEFCI